MSEKDQSNGQNTDLNDGSGDQAEFWFSEESQNSPLGSNSEHSPQHSSQFGKGGSSFLSSNLRAEQSVSKDQQTEKGKVSSSDIYGLRDPIPSSPSSKPSEPPFYASQDQSSVFPGEQSRSSGRSSGKFDEDSSSRGERKQGERKQKEPDFGEEFDKKENNFSLDDLYERKNRQKSIMSEEEYDDGQFERTELPRHPFWDRFFHPFFKIGFLFRFALLVLAAILPIFLVLFILICLKIQRTDIAGDPVTHSGGAILALDSYKLFFLSFFWGILSFPYAVFILEGSAAADDDLAEWPEFSMLGAIGMLCRLGLLILTAAIPAGLLSSVLPLPAVWIFAGGGAILIPIFLLSTLNADSMFLLLTKDVLRSFRKNAGAWLKFYGVDFILVGISLALSYVAAEIIGNSGNRLGAAFIFSLILAFSFSLIIYIFWRMLGRLAWIIDDTVRKDSEEDLSENLGEKSDEIPDNDLEWNRDRKV